MSIYSLAAELGKAIKEDERMIRMEKAKELILAYGTDRVLFGTDYPLWTPEEEIERFMSLDLTDEQREDILYNNTAKLFNI